MFLFYFVTRKLVVHVNAVYRLLAYGTIRAMVNVDADIKQLDMDKGYYRSYLLVERRRWPMLVCAFDNISWRYNMGTGIG